MSSQENKHPNSLLHYRKRMRLTQEHVAQLLGHKVRNAISSLESGYALPSLNTALKLAIIYRVPVDFLYSETYARFRAEIREREKTIGLPRQGVLAFSRP